MRLLYTIIIGRFLFGTPVGAALLTLFGLPLCYGLLMQPHPLKSSTLFVIAVTLLSLRRLVRAWMARE